MRIFTVLLKLKMRVSSQLRTRAAREVATLATDARLTPTAHIDNIVGRRDAIKIGRKTIIGGQLSNYGHGGSIQIGEWVFIGSGARIWSAESIEIGNRVLVSHNVDIHDNNSHPLESTARFEQTKAIFTTGHPRENPGIVSAPVRIEDDVWIGFGASVLKGVTIGEGAIIGARSVVTKDVPPYTIIAGNPARIVRELAPQERPLPPADQQKRN